MNLNEVQHEAVLLMHRRKFREAAATLMAAREHARRSGDRAEAAFLSGLLASCFMADSRDDDALRAYTDAEIDDPGNPFHSLASATFLMTVLNRPHDALARLEPAIESLLTLPSTAHVLRGLLGTIYLALDRIDDAVRLFRVQTQSEFDGFLSSSFDLYLVDALVARGLLTNECVAYLHTVSRRAAIDNDAFIAERVQQLINKIGTQERLE